LFLSQIESLHHIISCGPTDSFALDFELTGKDGFTAKDAVQPVIQVAFQYTLAVPAGELNLHPGVVPCAGGISAT
jgi:hypothetical protein